MRKLMGAIVYAAPNRQVLDGPIKELFEGLRQWVPDDPGYSREHLNRGGTPRRRTAPCPLVPGRYARGA
jgi:hypothetical protein